MADGSVIFDTKIDSSGFRTGLGKLGEMALKGVGTVITSIGAVSAAVGAAVLKVGSQALSSYADFQQLVGGVETLFGAGGKSIEEYAESVGKSVDSVKAEYDSLMAAQQDVLNKAANAYATAGMSANQYMETVTSFSASLIASLGGDTEKAARYADIAITDMSDNANKMGTAMESIQYAYQGFAKQNYTMLDNLKLGYGGTKTEMERLLKDAGELANTKFDISSYADVVEAIHVIQEEMGIAGTTADEAKLTISGSINSLKAAFDNLLVGFGDADADLEALCNTVVQAFVTVLKNVAPIAGNIAKAIPTAVNSILDSFSLSDALATVLDELVGWTATFADWGINLIESLVDGMLASADSIAQSAVELCEVLISGVIGLAPSLISVGVQLALSLLNGITSQLPSLIPTLVQGVLDAVKVLTDSDTLSALLNAALILVETLSVGILDAVPILIASLPSIIEGILGFFISSTPRVWEAGINLFTALTEKLPIIIDQISSTLPLIIAGITTTLLSNAPQIIDTGVRLLVSLVENLPHAMLQINTVAPQIISGLIKAFLSHLPEIKETGSNLIKGLWNGISDTGAWLWNKISGFFGNINAKIKDFFGIHSPSTLYRDMFGKNMALGIGVGFDLETDNVANMLEKDVKKMSSRLNMAVESEQDSLYAKASWTRPDSYNTDNRQYNNQVTQNFYNRTSTPSQVERAAREALKVKG